MRFSAVLLTLLMLAPARAAPPAATRWLQTNAVPLAATEPGAETTDLQALGELIGDAKVVGLGEATHGTREFFTLKDRFVRFLVTEKGFDTFVIEGSWAGALALNDYVLGGAGDPEQLLFDLGEFPWMTEEVVTMLRWMRAHNADPGNVKVRFYGADVKLHAVPVAVEQVAMYLGTLGEALASQARKDYACLLAGLEGETFYGALPESDKAACQKNLQAAYDLLETNRQDLVAASSQETFENALWSARMVQQAEEAYGYGNPDAPDADVGALLEPRDRFMAENVAWIQANKSPAGKVVFWAHNGHIGTRPGLLFGGKPTGAFLKDRYAEDYLALGFAMYGGAFNAGIDQPDGSQEMRASELPPPPESSYEAVLNRTDAPFALDLRGLSRSAPETAWLFGPRLFYHFVGASYSPTDPENSPSLQGSVLADEYDLLVFVRETSPTRFLPVTLPFGFPVETERVSDPSGRLSVPLLPDWSAEEREGYTLLTGPDGRAYLLSLRGDDPTETLAAAWQEVAPDLNLGEPDSSTIPPGFAGTTLALLYPLGENGSAVGAMWQQRETNLVLLVQASGESQDVLPALVQGAQLK